MESITFIRSVTSYDSHREEVIDVGEVYRKNGDLWCEVTVRIRGGREITLVFVWNRNTDRVVRKDDNGWIENFNLYMDAVHAAEEAFLAYGVPR